MQLFSAPNKEYFNIPVSISGRLIKFANIETINTSNPPPAIIPIPIIALFYNTPLLD